MDVLQVWKMMGDARRADAGRAFFEDKSLGEFHAAAHAFIGKVKNFRPQFVKKLPLEKRSSYLATLPLSSDLASQLIISWHFAHQRAMMAAFLNALQIQNDNGLITDDAELGAPTEEALTKAVESLRSSFSADDVNLYLATLLAQNPEVWGGLQKYIATPEAQIA